MKQSNSFLHYLKEEVIGYWQILIDEDFRLYMLALFLLLTFPVSLPVMALIRFVYDWLGE
ncbi:hypothetical protein [Xenorhabdus bovienii]|uniref:hypothetical protein n=1 Tax=Xenorhabdus bovienii TaxID=40576 RepID=UPI0004D5FE4D|nr:hypothetical protein [Xenorhabdus bovienii]CDG86551.1 hypothetical protein XBFFR1_1190028 [Xenorhabdus bovienii str. feltiae France]CDG94220.1 hypothetical protein XBFFL1_330028 [Xenorhabdus bovienii str. feltiae Florida]